MHLEIDLPSVLAHAAEGVVDAGPGSFQAQPEVLAHQRQIFRPGQLRHRLLVQLGQRVAEDLRQLRIGVRVAIVLDDVAADNRLLDQPAELVLARFQRLRGQLPFGDVAGDAVHADRPVAAVEQPAGQLERNPPAVLGDDLQLEELHLAVEPLLDRLAHRLDVFGRDQIPDAHLQRLFARVAGDLLAGLVHPGEPAFEIVRVDDVAGILDQLAIVRFLHGAANLP